MLETLATFIRSFDILVQDPIQDMFTGAFQFYFTVLEFCNVVFMLHIAEKTAINYHTQFTEKSVYCF